MAAAPAWRPDPARATSRAAASTFLPTERPPAAQRRRRGPPPAHDRNAAPRSGRRVPGELGPGALRTSEARGHPRAAPSAMARQRRPSAPVSGLRARKSLCVPDPPITITGLSDHARTTMVSNSASHSQASAVAPDTNAIARSARRHRAPPDPEPPVGQRAPSSAAWTWSASSATSSRPCRAGPTPSSPGSSSPTRRRSRTRAWRRSRRTPGRGGHAHPGRPAPRGHRPLGLDAVGSRDANPTSEVGEQISFKVGTIEHILDVDPNNSSLDARGQIEDMTGGDVCVVVNTGTENRPPTSSSSLDASGEERRITDTFQRRPDRRRG